MVDWVALFHLSIFSVFLFGASAIAVYDTATYRIPNLISVVLVAGFALGAMLLPIEMDIASHLASALIVFGVGFVAYWFGLVGAGDVKSWAAVALWADLNTVATQALTIALFGGAIGVFLLVLRQLLAWVCMQKSGGAVVLPRLLRHGQPIPYGIAIGSGAIATSWALPLFPGPW